MHITVIGKHLDLGDALRGRVDDELPAAIGKYFANAIDAEVVFAKWHHRFRCDMSVHIGRDIRMNATAEGDDAHLAFDATTERLTKRLRRYKRRLKDHHRDHDESARLSAATYVLDAERSDDDVEAAPHPGDGHEPLIVAEMESVIETLTPSEALMRLDLGELPALMFRNREHGGLNMIYRRKDGNIGWVDPRGAGMADAPTKPAAGA